MEYLNSLALVFLQITIKLIKENTEVVYKDLFSDSLVNIVFNFFKSFIAFERNPLRKETGKLLNLLLLKMKEHESVEFSLRVFNEFLSEPSNMYSQMNIIFELLQLPIK